MVRATERMWGRWWGDVCKMKRTRRRVNRMRLTDRQWQKQILPSCELTVGLGAKPASSVLFISDTPGDWQAPGGLT